MCILFYPASQDLELLVSACCVRVADIHTGDERLDRMGMSIEHRAANLGTLGGMIVALRVASLAALALKRWERR